jgi:hypothetical protein
MDPLSHQSMKDATSAPKGGKIARSRRTGKAREEFTDDR